ncbi:hypothetical protein Hanom_Chr07g00644561 [Helianthus anomalus]
MFDSYSHSFLRHSGERTNTGGAGPSWIGDEVLPIISLSCLQAGGGRVFVHMGEPRGWRRLSSRPWSQRPVSR